MEGFCRWVMHDLYDIVFVWNFVMIAATRGAWLILMALYYWLFKRKGNKND